MARCRHKGPHQGKAGEMERNEMETGGQSPDTAGWKPQAKACGQLLNAGKGRKVGSLLESPGAAQLCGR